MIFFFIDFNFISVDKNEKSIGTTLLEKYSYPVTKTSPRISSVLEKYGERVGDKSRESETASSRYVNSSYRAGLRENEQDKSSEKNTGNDNSVNSRTSSTNSNSQRTNATLPRSFTSTSTREPSPDTCLQRTKPTSFKIQGRITNYGQTGTSCKILTIISFHSFYIFIFLLLIFLTETLF